MQSLPNDAFTLKMAIQYTSICRSSVRQITFFSVAKQLFVFLVFFSYTFFTLFSDTAFAKAEPVQPVTLHNQEEGTVALTTEEQVWLDAHPNIELGYTDAFEPAVIVNKDGSYRGTLVDFLVLLNQRLGTDIKLTVKPIPDVFSQVSRKELAGVLSLHPDNADKRGFLKTQDYMTSYPTVFTRIGVAFTTPDDLVGKKITIIDNVFFSQNLVDLYGDGSTIIKVKSALEGLERVKDGTADLFIGSSRNSYLLGKYQFFDLAASFQFYDHPTPNVIAVRNDWPQLVSILNKGLAAISVEEIEAILRKWISIPDQKKAIELTEEERDWLYTNPRINVGVYSIPPYMFVENGRIQGSLVDMMQVLAGQVGLTVEFSMHPLAETLPKIKSGQYHAVLGMIHTEERAGFMYFSENVMGMQMSIFARTSRSDIKDAASLGNKVIASYNGYGFEPVLEKYLPNARIVRAEDAVGMLRLVASGKADAAVQELYSGEFILHDSFINGVNPKGPFALPGLPTITGSEYAVSRKFPLLHSILSKSYKALPDIAKKQVWRKWFAGDSERAMKKQITLTPEEKAWLNQNTIVRVRATDWPPYLIVKENEPPQGIAIEYLKLISERSGINFKFEVKKQPFAEFLESMKQHQGPDMAPLIIQSPDREQYLSFTAPYIASPYVIFAREQEELLLDISDLAGKTLAVPRGFVMQQLLEKDYPAIRLVLFDNDEQSLFAVSTGKVDAYIGNLTVASHIIQKRGFSNLRVVTSTPYGDQVLSMGNRIDWPELTLIINKALAGITEEEKTAIRNKYIALRYEQGINRIEVLKWVLISVVIATGILLLFVIWNRQLRRKVRVRTTDLEAEIVERIQAEEALRDSEEKFRSLMEQSPLSIQILNLDGKILQVNEAFKNLWGVSGESLSEVLEKYNVLEDDQTRKLGVTTHIEKAFKGESVSLPVIEYDASSTVEKLEIKGIEANKRWIQARLYPIRNSKGEVVNVINIEEDISAGKLAEEKILIHQQRLKSLASQLILAEEKERSRLAADLHDHIGQTLAFSRIQVTKAKKYATEEKLVTILDDLSQSLLKTIQDTKELVFDLSSPLLNELGLEAAIAHWLEENIARKHGLEFELVSERMKFPLSKDVKSILFRNVRELLTNVIRHAKASKVIVSLVNNETEMKIAVSDDGTGFDVHELKKKEEKMKKFGLFSIRERMEDMGGSMEILSEPGKGCKIILSIPLGSGDEQPTVEI